MTFKCNSKTMDMPEEEVSIRRPLGEVVSDCVFRWYDATLKAAVGGDTVMQSLLGQMFASGYGAPRDIEKAIYWLQKASEKDVEARRMLSLMTERDPEARRIFMYRRGTQWPGFQSLMRTKQGTKLICSERTYLFADNDTL
ncbi:hypothetical protein CBR_g20420 [Chara braunii]|uniref:Sel1 repeat family protein n=1 Tax=Chara braunii TaxID=69332 RepID=A0A388JU99_CHABU|nr:hypothetical protein CBR_g20420 [Chara braunii]|eukprot:GBG61389.1 hypothetical protein CBR_g20420 [Chara braunii]